MIPVIFNPTRARAVVAEAISHGVPVTITRNMTNPEWVREANRVMKLFQSEIQEALAKADLEEPQWDRG